MRSADPTIPVSNATSMEAIVRDSVARYTFTSILLSVAAGVALLLAAVGLYGVVSYVVGQRTREIGTRIALGARPGEVEGLFLRKAVVLVMGGLVVGLVLATGLSRLMEGLLYGVEPTNPIAFLAAAVVLTAVAALATWIPARRAARIDPSTALRADG